jgi:hypothetical protein
MSFSLGTDEHWVSMTTVTGRAGAPAGPGGRAGAGARAEGARLRRSRARRLAAGVLLVLVALAEIGRIKGAVPVAAAVLGAGILVALTAVSGRRRDIDRWTRGADGEASTAELLGVLPTRRWAVWHDLRVPGSRANIDHLVVGRSGVWVVDTKTTRAEVTAGWRSVHFGGRRLDPAVTIWEAEVVEDQLSSQLGWPVPVRAVIAVHGRGLRRRGGRAGGVRVVPAAELTGRIRRGRRRLGYRARADVGRAVERVFGGDR